MLHFNKSLSTDDISAVEFVKELLGNEPTFGINFDRIQWDKVENRYVIVEFLLCHERQFERGITPFTSHPNKYFFMNNMKFGGLWKLANVIEARLLLVNYSKKGTAFEDQVLLLEVLNIDEADKEELVTAKIRKFTRQEFTKWFKALNRRGQI